MKIKAIINNIRNSSRAGQYLISKCISIYYTLLGILPDKLYCRIIFRLRFKYKLNLANPRTLNEKIQWLKIYDRSPLHTLCADKYLVRNYIKEKIGDKYLIPLIYKTNDPELLSSKICPEYPVILKANHLSGSYHIIKNKNIVNWDIIRKDARKWLKTNWYHTTKEWQYKNIPPCLIIEKLLLDENNSVPSDIKIHCFHSIPTIIQVDKNRGTPYHFRNWYNADWTRTKFKWSSFTKNHFTDPSIEVIPRPKKLDELLRLSSVLSKEFKYARIDWYIIQDRIYFGEITFHHDSGFRPIVPFEYDLFYGAMVKL